MNLRAAFGGLLLTALLAGAVDAKVLYVFHNSGNSATFVPGAQATRDMVTRYLDGLGATVRVVGSSQVLEDSLRAGRVQESDGSWSAPYDVVVHCINASEAYPANYTPKTLTLRAGKPWVPQLLLMNPSDNGGFNNATTCSTGVSGITATLADSAYIMWTTNRPWVWRSKNIGRPPIALAGRATGTFRSLIGIGATASKRAPYGSGDFDSLLAGRSANPDTLRAWVVYNRTTDNSAPVTIGGRDEAPNVFCNFSGSIRDGDVAGVLYCFAWLDSLTGGKVFEDRSKTPITVAVGIDDGWKRGRRGIVQQGLDPSDTVFVKASVDSLHEQCKIAVPHAMISLGVELDSLTSYPQDGLIWSRLDPFIVYTPHVHGGQTAVPTLRSAAFPLDLFAQGRPYLCAYDPVLNGAATDTSMYGNLLHARQLIEARFGAAKVDRLIQPASDRFIPNGTVATGVGGAMTCDSVMWAAARAGFRGWRFNALNGASSSQMNETNTGSNLSNSYIWDDGWLRAGPNGTPLRMRAVGMPGYSGITPRAFDGLVSHYNSALLNGLFGGWGGSSGYTLDAWVTATTYNTQSSLRMMVLHVSELGSNDVVAGTDLPVRQMYWQIKHLIHATSAINQMCGSTLIRVGRPDEIDK